MIGIYRLTIFLLLLLQLMWYFVPWEFAYGNDAAAILRWLGKNSYLSFGSATLIGNSMMALGFASYLGMLFFQNWARILFVLVAILGGGGIALYGISVESSYESMLSYFITLGDGFIIALSYFSVLKCKFKPTSRLQD